MKIPHPYFIYQLQFLVTKPYAQNLISQIEECVFRWDNTSSGIHSMGGRGFYFQKKEFAHVHWNGDLDIYLGKGLTAELLKQNLVQEHKFVKCCDHIPLIRYCRSSFCTFFNATFLSQSIQKRIKRKKKNAFFGNRIKQTAI
jgi:hypothetical protein